MGQLEEIETQPTTIEALKDWLLERICDDEDIIVDELQQDQHARLELRDKSDPKSPKGTKEYLRNCDLLSEEKQGNASVRCQGSVN